MTEFPVLLLHSKVTGNVTVTKTTGFGTGPACLPNLLQHLDFMLTENNLNENLNIRTWKLMRRGHRYILFNNLSLHKMFN